MAPCRLSTLLAAMQSHASILLGCSQVTLCAGEQLRRATQTAANSSVTSQYKTCFRTATVLRSGVSAPAVSASLEHNTIKKDGGGAGVGVCGGQPLRCSVATLPESARFSSYTVCLFLLSKAFQSKLNVSAKEPHTYVLPSDT